MSCMGKVRNAKPGSGTIVGPEKFRTRRGIHENKQRPFANISVAILPFFPIYPEYTVNHHVGRTAFESESRVEGQSCQSDLCSIANR
jgi:hypothetical protein